MNAYMSIHFLFLALGLACCLVAVYVPEFMIDLGRLRPAIRTRLTAFLLALALCIGPDLAIGLLRSKDIDLHRNTLSRAVGLFVDDVTPSWLKALSGDRHQRRNDS